MKLIVVAFNDAGGPMSSVVVSVHSLLSRVESSIHRDDALFGELLRATGRELRIAPLQASNIIVATVTAL
jgi:hypothetical protein